MTPARSAFSIFGVCLALAACSSTTTTDMPSYGPATITPVSGFAETGTGMGAADLVANNRFLLMDDVLRECVVGFSEDVGGPSYFEMLRGACSHEMVHVAGWRTAGDTLDLFNADGEVIGRLTVESNTQLRGKLTVLSGLTVDATLTRL